MSHTSPMGYLSVLMIGLAVAGCNSSSGLPADPVDDYLQFLEYEFGLLEKTNPRIVIDTDYRLDVQTTNSLVSPLAGSCKTSVLKPIVTEDYSILWSLDVELKHGYQDGEWVFTSGTCVIIAGTAVKDDANRGIVKKTIYSLIGNKYNLTSIGNLTSLW